MIQNFIPSVHPDGWRFIGIFALISIIFGIIAAPLGWLGLGLTAWCIYFFRDPKRVSPQGSNFILSPADGLVCFVGEANPPAELELKGENWTRVSIFLSVFDAHVNRIPADGTILKSVYHPGKFFNASLDKASEHNERQALSLEMTAGKTIAFVQIAGLIARRIVCEAREGQEVQAGERFGLIRFGSRVDVYLPEGVRPLVLEGQRMIAGETLLADLNSAETQRTGLLR